MESKPCPPHFFPPEMQSRGDSSRMSSSPPDQAKTRFQGLLFVRIHKKPSWPWLYYRGQQSLGMVLWTLLQGNLVTLYLRTKAVVPFWLGRQGKEEQTFPRARHAEATNKALQGASRLVQGCQAWLHIGIICEVFMTSQCQDPIASKLNQYL